MPREAIEQIATRVRLEPEVARRSCLREQEKWVEHWLPSVLVEEGTIFQIAKMKDAVEELSGFKIMKKQWLFFSAVFLFLTMLAFYLSQQAYHRSEGMAAFVLLIIAVIFWKRSQRAL